jgi:hypothetical protein
MTGCPALGRPIAMKGGDLRVAKRRDGGIAETNAPSLRRPARRSVRSQARAVLYYGEIYNRVVRRSGGALGGVAKANRRKNSENEEDHENGQLREFESWLGPRGR